MKKSTLGSSSRAIGVALAATTGLLAGGARAQDIPPGMEAFKLNVGGILSTNNASIRLDGSGGRGSDLDLERLTGVKEDVSSFFISGTWRVAPRHRVGVTWFQVDRDNTKTIDRTITIGDTVIPINTSLSTENNAQFFFASYRYSFIKTQDIELAGLAGIFGANLEYKFRAANPIVDISRSTVAPLPIFGLSADFYFGPRWTATLYGAGMAAKIGDVDGHIYHVGASTEYMFTRNWGVGVGYQMVDMKADVTKSDFQGHLSWRMDGYFAYLQARF